MNFINALRTILGWTLLGVMSAYVVASIYSFSYTFIVLLILNEIPTWLCNMFIYGGGTGFLLGAIKAAVRST